MEIFVEAPGAEPSTHQRAELVVHHHTACGCGDADEREFECVGGASWPGIYHGAVNLGFGPLRGSTARRIGLIRFERPIHELSRVFLVVHYEVP